LATFYQTKKLKIENFENEVILEGFNNQHREKKNNFLKNFNA
jgi:hypothetical protein